MRKLYIKQKLFSIGEKFHIYDENERPQYYVEGSFFKIPKTFTIYNQYQIEVATITKKVWSFLPKFYVDIRNSPQIMIEKDFTFFKASYQISAQGIEVAGNWWDMDFEVLRFGRPIAKIHKKWLSWGDTYEVEIYNEDFEETIVALVIAIDCVKADQGSSSNASVNMNS
ncbi:LURP-one-related/scramblase family protein [Enterococcus lemanii]|uniref:LURP-one-related/scramblase family protein n=1 Tax=Enterococcus lemanii TaxID=1159752 RepID=A0ABV9MWA9_9ENTE|nr:LURP-one-related family protein [Enterococcus lemanii]MBM7710309.1 uncharacterized protein YxjI [Enterococcus lemanii]